MPECRAAGAYVSFLTSESKFISSERRGSMIFGAASQASDRLTSTLLAAVLKLSV